MSTFEASSVMICTIFLRIARIWADLAYVVFLIWFGRFFVKAMQNKRTR